jgi:hypothetical protein
VIFSALKVRKQRSCDVLPFPILHPRLNGRAVRAEEPVLRLGAEAVGVDDDDRVERGLREEVSIYHISKYTGGSSRTHDGPDTGIVRVVRVVVQEYQDTAVVEQ